MLVLLFPARIPIWIIFLYAFTTDEAATLSRCRASRSIGSA
jgi:hypothetical protein